jgi:gluconate 5-dehydrogenase
MAAALAAAGAHVVLLARQAAGLAEAAQAIVRAGGEASIRPLDITDEGACIEAIRTIGAEHGRLDILVNNAGIIGWSAFTESTTDAWRATLDTNLTPMFVLSREAAGLMRRQGSGRILNIGSLLSVSGRGRLAAYCTSKAAIVGITRSLAAELGPDGITCNCIAPGYFATDINTNLVARPGFTEMVSACTPLRRWGRPEDLGGIAVFLASDAAAFITGQVILVDGGLSAVAAYPPAA